MKKIFTLLFCVAMLLTIVPFSAFAEDIGNVAPSGIAYSSADYNEWAPKTAINNENYNDSWQAQHPTRDPSVGSVGEYCGVKFMNQYYLVSELRICIGTHSNEVTYGINVLVEGEWIEVAERKESDATEIDGRSWFIIPLKEPLTTNNVRVIGKDYATSNWDLPLVKEVEIYGVKTETPELVVPEGGIITYNAALQGLAYASSSAEGQYSALINNNKNDQRLWNADGDELPAYVGVKLADTRTVSRIVVMTGAPEESSYTVSFNIEAEIDGVRTVLTSAACSSENNYILEYTLPEKIRTDDVRIVYTDTTVTPQLSELEIWSDERNVFMEEGLTEAELNSAAKGNLAIFGTPYSENTFDLYAVVDVINDGKISGKNASWAAFGNTVPTYCGVVLAQPAAVNKVVLYFEEQAEPGTHVMSFEVQALINDAYVTLASDFSYNKTVGYVAIVEFDTTVTTDIRILFTKNGDIFPSVNEIEVYAETNEIAPYDGYVIEETFGGAVKPSGYDQAVLDATEVLTYDTTTRNSLPDYIPAKSYDINSTLKVTLLAETATGIGAILFVVHSNKKKKS